MTPKRIIEIAFSPCGNTEKVAHTIAEELAKRYEVELVIDRFTLPKEREEVRSFSQDDLLVIASPTYAGKLPNKILPDFQSKIKGSGTKAVAIVTYGNRAFENSLAELYKTLEDSGFKICAAATVVAEHSMAHIAKGRPNENDIESLKNFAAKINIDTEVSVVGDANAPYYVPKQENGEAAKFLPAKPKTDMQKCINCGLCAKLCPMGSIDFDDVSNVLSVCIKCHACIKCCSQDAKYFDDEQLMSHIRMLKANFEGYNENQFFI